MSPADVDGNRDGRITVEEYGRMDDGERKWQTTTISTELLATPPTSDLPLVDGR